MHRAPEGGSRSFRHLTFGSSRSSKKWRKLKKVAEARSSRKKIKKIFSECSKINSRKINNKKEIKKFQKRTTQSQNIHKCPLAK